MTVEEQMKFWDERENDEVGKLISFAYDETEDVLTYFDIWGIEHNPIKLVLDEYDVEESVARKDVHDFVTVLRERSLINE